MNLKYNAFFITVASLLISFTLAFNINDPKVLVQQRRFNSLKLQGNEDSDEKIVSTKGSTPRTKEELLPDLGNELFPVLSRIQGRDWTGSCQYVDGNLNHLSKINITGGIRYNIKGDSGECSLSSFIVLPNGKRREVIMLGERSSDNNNNNVTTTSLPPPFRLDPVSEEGPIYMILTELPPDKVLINEVDKASGKIVMSSSLLVVNGGKELIQVSHESGDAQGKWIEGHQVWHLRPSSIITKDSD
eukprot:CAMPEP_0194137816 /NCGR_PEP_ID=MMETSP0152-20130528/7649_1 /TAXON_ID=1049557 /ORGANISM="Thalassiothrix antarctica, Strain L6-D1" /LENGTH=244 /DNA_ID=CAMNT_0038834975 /DNA_START=24 /DNA_END=758 /DNA_ORIENTATION=-